MCEQNVGILDLQQFGASTADFGDNRPGIGQFGVQSQERLNTEIRDPVDLGLIDRDDLESSGRINPIEKRQFIACFADCAGRDYADLVCLLYTSPSPRDRQKSRMPSSA